MASYKQQVSIFLAAKYSKLFRDKTDKIFY